jgi:hypothetical protein
MNLLQSIDAHKQISTTYEKLIAGNNLYDINNFTTNLFVLNVCI